ncbi:hypothetical protein HWV62_8973 [Athelia sp. TMB]|nr:hypothetical protein HWV62_8973 [Athelia sp. TMB]
MAAYVIGVAAAVTGAVIAPFAAPAVLGVVGFGALGPIAGSVAAGMQGAAVVAGSSFAVAQSVAAGGALPAIGYGAAGAIAGSAATVAAWFSGV